MSGNYTILESEKNIIEKTCYIVAYLEFLKAVGNRFPSNILMS